MRQLNVVFARSTCKRRGCNGAAAALCSTGYCQVHCFSNRCHCRNHGSTSGQAGRETLPGQVPGPGPGPGPSGPNSSALGSTNPAPPAPSPVHLFRPSSRISANSVPAPHPGLHVCQRAFCRNSVADCCRTGHVIVLASVVLAMFPLLRPMPHNLFVSVVIVIALWPQPV